MISPNYNKEKRYIITPGLVRSKHDGDIHHISAGKLARLYGVPLHADNVIVIREDDHRARRFDTNNDIFLHPKESGDYTLPT